MSDIRETLRLTPDLRHRHVVALEEAIFHQRPGVLLAARSSSSAGVYTRAAIEAGWIASPKTESGKFGDEVRHFVDGVNVDEMPPWEVRYIGAAVATLYEELTGIPKN